MCVCVRACTHILWCTCEGHGTTSCRSHFPPSTIGVSGMELSSPTDGRHLHPLNHLTSPDPLFKYILYSAFMLILSQIPILNWNACLHSIELWEIWVFVL